MQILTTYRFFKDDTPDGWKMSAEFKKTFCTNVTVYFMGLWDCVASVGFFPRKLPFSKSPTNSIHFFRHAMALDEHRSKFKICQWQHQDPALQRAKTYDATPKGHIKRGMKRGFDAFGRKRNQSDQANSDPDIKKINGFVHPHGHQAHHDGGAWRDLDGHSEKSMEQAKLEKYFEALDASRKKHHKVRTDALEVWFMSVTQHLQLRNTRRLTNTKGLSRRYRRWRRKERDKAQTGKYSPSMDDSPMFRLQYWDLVRHCGSSKSGP